VRIGSVRRVVSLAPSTTEILFAIGAGSMVVGVDRYSDFPEQTRTLEKVGADIDPSLERIVALKPDLVFIATSANAQATGEALERLGVPLFVSRVETLEDVYRDIGAIGDAVDRRKEAFRTVASLRARIQAVSTRVAGEPPAKTAVVVWTDPLVLAGGKSHVADLLSASGGINIAQDSPQPFPSYSLERLVERAPEVLVLGTHADVKPPRGALEKLTSVPAVRNHRMVDLDGDLLFRPGPRLGEGAEALGRALHPNRFDGATP
jgi:iron complex transport system substrate-binding protein